MSETRETPDEAGCVTCRKPKAAFKHHSLCGICQRMSCKDCAQFLEDGAFSFLEKIPDELRHPAYCQACYDEKVAPELVRYAAAMERAKEVFVFYKKHDYLQVIRRSRKIVSVRECADRKEALLRLAFFAAQQSYNALINVELIAEKVQIAGYQTSNWTGTGLPADVKPAKER